MLGVYYSEEMQSYEIRGVMIWKGEEIAQTWKDQGSYEYHSFTKLDSTQVEDQGVVRDYWLKRDSAEGLALYSS